MELADAHIHLFPNGFQTRYGVLFPEGRELEIYEHIRKEHRISDALVVGYEGDPAYNGNNLYLAQLAPHHPWIHPLAFAHATTPPSRGQLEQWWHTRFAGIALYLGLESDAQAFAQWPSETLRALNHTRAIISINLPNTLLPLIQGVLGQLTECSVLISHLGLPKNLTPTNGAEQVASLLTLASLPHVGVKASAFYACGNDWHEYPHPLARGAFDAILNAFGPERLYWGSDFSPALEFISVQQSVCILEHFKLEESTRTAIYGGNLRRLLASRSR